MIPKNPYLLYLVKFIGAFCILYFGTKAIIGLAAPGHYYSEFVHSYLNYPALLRKTLLYGAKTMLLVVGYQSYTPDTYHLQLVGGRSVRMVYSCLGIGILSFWTAFIFANKGSFKKKLVWITGGLLLIWLINITRVALFLLSFNKKLYMPFKMDNHTFFNIGAYIAIFIMIWRYDRYTKSKLQTANGRS
ncbi:MAG: hypothetical protein ABIQ31_19495 [Ferruginibacter sp.]